MSLPLPYINFNTDTARRLGVGVVLGVLTAVTVMPFLKTNTSVGQLDFVSETIEIVSSKIKTKTPKDVASAPTTAKTDIMDNAVYFPAFAKHMQSMNAYQLDAVINDTPRLALVLNDVGQSRKIVAQILEKIPSAVTVGLSAHTQNHNDVAKQFSTYGFEIWMNMAALTLDMTADRGDHALNPTHNFERNIKGLSSQLDNKDKITGVMLPQQSLITETPDLWADITDDLFGQGFGILDNTPTITPPAQYFYDDRRAPYLKGDVTLPADITLTDLQSSLNAIRKDIQNQKNMTVTIYASTPASLDIIADWVNSLGQDGITLVPLSAQTKL